MKIKKRALSLLEVSIALFLVGILITLLIRFYTETQLLEHTLDKKKMEIVERQHFQTRINKIFLSIPKASGSQDEKPFYTEKRKKEKNHRLTFLFENGIDPYPDFSGPVIGSLHVDKEQNLSLLIWPLENPKKNLIRKEILMQGVKRIEYDFFTKEKEEFVWKKEWQEEQETFPIMARITVTKSDEKTPFAFFLPIEDSIINYEKKR